MEKYEVRSLLHSHLVQKFYGQNFENVFHIFNVQWIKLDYNHKEIFLYHLGLLVYLLARNVIFYNTIVKRTGSLQVLMFTTLNYYS